MPKTAMVKIVATLLVAICAMNAWATTCFDDANLKTLDFQASRGALLYVWSPRMVLSLQHAASAQRQAQQHGLRFVPLHDAKVPQAELDGAKGAALTKPALPRPGRPDYAQSARALTSSRPLCATSLLERDALRHFPTAFVVQASGVHRYPIIGAMPELAWASSIAQRLSIEVQR
jgi:hypothetical protein